MSNPWQIQTTQFDRTNSEGNTDYDGYGRISILLSKYVLKEKGKGLSTNDFTDECLDKLNNIENKAQVNKLETLSINNDGVLEPDEEKNINIHVPTKMSELESDVGFAKLINASESTDYSDSYVGKSKLSFMEEENIAIGKNANADEGGIAIGKNTSTTTLYDINIADKLKHNTVTDMFECKTTTSHTANIAIQNSNGTNLTQLDTVIGNLESEVTTRTNADTALENSLSSATSRITTIENKIPSQATSTNQLADKAFVNSSIQTNTANYRGSWNTWSDVPTNANSYPTDYSGSKIPTTNDYLVVLNASDYTLDTLSGTWRFKYVGNWDTDGKNGWMPEYQVNEEPLTSEQVYAINSGITSTKVTSYDNHLNNTSNPHSVTASQVGLGNVTNVATESTITQNSNKNITSGAVYSALALKMNASVTHLSGDVPISRTINSKTLDQDITLSASDVGALPDNQANTVDKDGYVTAPTSNNTNKVWKTDDLGNPAWRDEIDPTAVHLTGDQTINGNKTFSNPIIGTVNNAISMDYPLELSTSASTSAKTVSLEGFTLEKGARLIINVTVANTYEGELTLSVNSTTAKVIKLNGYVTSNMNFNLSVGNYDAYYDGINWCLDSVCDSHYARHCGEISSHTLVL